MNVSKKKTANKKKSEPEQNTPCKKVKIIQLSILGFAIVIALIGALLGGYSDVLTKAVNICTECIGLG